MRKEKKVNRLWYLSPIVSFILSLISSNPVIFVGFFIIWTAGLWSGLRRKNAELAKRLALIDAIVMALGFILNLYLFSIRVLIPI